MTPEELVQNRLVTQSLVDDRFSSVSELVRHMGAIQAQDFAMAKWAIGIRVPGIKEEDVQGVLDRGTILRTHVLRPTWHIVHADDIQWMIELTGPHVRKLMNFTNKALDLTPEIYRKSNSIIEKLVENGAHLSREAIMEVLASNNLDVSSIRPAHYMMEAELAGIVCSGRMQGKNQTYALLSERAPNTVSLEREEATARLAASFLNSHGPATANDFAWWSGLPMKDVRFAFSEVSKNFETVERDGQVYYFPRLALEEKATPQVHLLPAFDELLISYKDRSASMALDHQPLAFTKNGIFKPVVVVDGRAIGIWKRTIRRDQVHIAIDYFRKPEVNIEQLVAQAAESFGFFLSKTVVL